MHQIRRAIILAAGRGTRLRPYTDTIPKPMLPVNHVPIIERLIMSLHQAHIYDITIVTGYRARQFEYLKSLYNVNLVRNPDFNHGSNLLSLKCVSHLIDDCILLDGDIILNPRAIRSEVPGSGYSYVHRTRASEWAIIFKSSNHIDSIVPDLTEKHDFNALYSISYWVGDGARQLRQLIHNHKDDVNYYDDLAITIPNLYGYKIRSSDLTEIDTVEDYERLLKGE